jgi:hypothetical protein
MPTRVEAGGFVLLGAPAPDLEPPTALGGLEAGSFEGLSLHQGICLKPPPVVRSARAF